MHVTATAHRLCNNVRGLLEFHLLSLSFYLVQTLCHGLPVVQHHPILLEDLAYEVFGPLRRYIYGA